MIDKLKSYFLYTRDDNLLFEVNKNRFHCDGICRPASCKLSSRKILVDSSHLGYQKWSLKLLLIIRNRRSNGVSAVHGLYPSRLFIWYLFTSFIISAFKLVYNKDRRLSKAMGIDRLVSIRFFGGGSMITAYKMASAIKSSINSKQDVIDLSIDGVRVGDVIYDNYLKWFKEPTVDISGRRFYFILFLACLYYIKIKKLFEIERYDEVYLTHSVYIAFGIVARVALAQGADVYVTQNTRGLFIQRLTVDHPFQTPRFKTYKDTFDALSPTDKVEASRSASEKLNNRLSGHIDGSISYMRKSAYDTSSSIEVGLVEHFPGRPYAVIMLHCFFDSPHIYKWMLFPDFHEWVIHCLSFCEFNKFNVIVKSHPNGLDGNEAVVRSLQKRFVKANFISSSISNKCLVEMDAVKVALTVYGTMCHEFSYLGLPVINAGDNPHIAYDFSKTPRSISEFDKLLFDVMCGASWICNKSEIEQFYYMNYLSEKPGYISFYDESIEAGFSYVSSYKNLLDVIDGYSFEALEADIQRCFNDQEVYSRVV